MTKKTTKKKKSVKCAPRPTQGSHLKDDEADALIDTRTKTTGCLICREPIIAESVRAILRSMARKHRYRFPIREILAILRTKHPESDLGQRGLERHLQIDERSLYDQARGRA